MSERAQSLIVPMSWQICPSSAERGEEEQRTRSLPQPWVWHVSDFIFAASALEDGCGQSSPSSPHLPTDSVWSVYSL